MFQYRSLSRKAAAWAALLCATALLCLTRPSGGQQPVATQPDIQVTLPATASPGRTRVDYALTLPAGLTLTNWPAVRVVDQSGKLVEYAGLCITARTPRLTGTHRLWTKSYPPGRYRVTVEVGFKHPDATAATFITPASTLTVP